MELPEIFENLEHSGLESIEFELVDVQESEDALDAWFGGPTPEGCTLTVFAQDGTGGLYVVYQTDGVDINKAPIVLLGSEGQCVAIAASPELFLQAMASGKVISPYDGQWYPIYDEDEDDEDELILHEQAQQWVKKTLGLASLPNPETISGQVTSLTNRINEMIESMF